MKQNKLELEHRKLLIKTKRVVVKIGTHVLVNKNGTPNRHRIANLAHDIIQLKKYSAEYSSLKIKFHFENVIKTLKKTWQLGVSQNLEGFYLQFHNYFYQLC